ncbi:hypothetical protein OUZ56_030090 [Daphnia magna]|uniref:Uncharacterized protein n=1 Tax=Daphnia magna TaxID=35525 RepID=A0ABQ9ZR48_9CRUS|nr:hypothetical protein OUZ56_030090 [Daphnia magna]
MKEKFTNIHANLGSGSSHAPAIATDERGSFSPSFFLTILDLIYTKDASRPLQMDQSNSRNRLTRFQEIKTPNKKGGVRILAVTSLPDRCTCRNRRANALKQVIYGAMLLLAVVFLITRTVVGGPMGTSSSEYYTTPASYCTTTCTTPTHIATGNL